MLEASPEFDAKRQLRLLVALGASERDAGDRQYRETLLSAAELARDIGDNEQLLAAAFPFTGGERPVYWIYGFKRGAFWPFVPTGKNERDNALELELKAKLEG